MGDLNLEKVSEQYYDVLKELGNIGAGNAMTALSQMLNCKIDMRVPKVAPYLKGVINLRGEVLPVVSLRLKMGLDEDVFDKATRIIILKTENEGQIGILVDEVKEVVTLSERAIEKISHDSKSDKANFLSGVGKNNGELISILDLNMITLEDN